MIVVLPAPVAPTNAALEPGSTRNDTSRSTQSSSLRYENQTRSNSTAPRRSPGRIGRTASGGSSTAGSVSSSSKIRSALAIDDCITEYFADRSRSGRKKRRVQSMNR